MPRICECAGQLGGSTHTRDVGGSGRECCSICGYPINPPWLFPFVIEGLDR